MLAHLAAYALVEGPAAGSDADVVTMAGTWTAAANASWLHTSSGGTGNGLATFTFGANPGASRTGTLTIAGETLSVTQAGSSYVAARPFTTLTTLVPGQAPRGVAVDASGNVYNSNFDAIKKWNASSGTLSTLVSSGLLFPYGVAVDASGNVYIADTFDNAIKEWNAASGTLGTLVSSGLNLPYGVAVDASGNVYIADTWNNAIEEWNASSGTLGTLVSSGLNTPGGVAVDASGNVYIADTEDNAIKEWNASSGTLSTLVSSGLNGAEGVAVDASGNVYIADTGNNAIEEWNASSGTLSTLVSSGLDLPEGVAVDASGNVYIADTFDNAIEELPRAFVPQTALSEGAAAGSDALAAVLPSNESLAGVFAPTSNQPWLTISGVSAGAVQFFFTQNNTGAARTAQISLLGQQITVSQAAAATATINVTPYSVTYDAAAHTATGTANGASGPLPASDLVLSGTTHTSAGTYTDTWTFTDPTGNYASASGTVTDTIAQATLTPSITANGRTYDGGTTVTLATHSVATTFGSDVVSLEVGASSFTSASAGTETVTATGLSLGGADAANYTLSATTASTTAVIAQATLTPVITADGRTYNGSTLVTLASQTASTPFIPDVVNLEVGASSFTSKSAGTETVTATGLSLGGADAANYTLSATTASTTAVIAQATLTPVITADGRTYNGSTLVTLASQTASTPFIPDVVNLEVGASSFTSKSAGTETVTATGLSLNGTRLSCKVFEISRLRFVNLFRVGVASGHRLLESNDLGQLIRELRQTPTRSRKTSYGLISCH